MVATPLQLPSLKPVPCLAFSEDPVWSREFDAVADFEKALNIWQKEYNEDYPHSSLGHMTPYEYERWFQASAA